MIVALIVVDAVIVAALVNGADTVDLIDAVCDRTVDVQTAVLGRAPRTGRWMPPLRHRDPSAHGIDHTDDVVPVHERGHDQGAPSPITLPPT